MLAYGHNGDHTTWLLGADDRATLSSYERLGDRVVCVKQEILAGSLTAIVTNTIAKDLDVSAWSK